MTPVFENITYNHADNSPQSTVDRPQLIVMYFMQYYKWLLERKRIYIFKKNDYPQ